jgi:two-component system, chemotaxis family, response regulator Rcp1
LSTRIKLSRKRDLEMSVLEAVGRPMEVLLIEDSLVSARITIGALRKGKVQHRMTWLTDGNDALDFIYQRQRFSRAPRPDLILLDLGLPGRDGREILADIKGNDELKEIPVVVLTGSQSSYEDFQESEQLSVEGYMNKPVDLEKFLFLVKELKQYWHAGVILPAV